MKHLRKIVLAAFFAYGGQALAQQAQPLYLHSGTVQVPANLSEFVKAQEPTDRFGGWYYRVLQFNVLPSEQMKQTVNQSGIRLLEYLPKNAFVAAIPVRYDRTRLATFGVTGVYQLSADQKIHKNIIGGFQSWAYLEPGKVDLNVQYHKNLRREEILNAAMKHGQIVNYLDQNNTIVLRISEFGLRALAAEPWVFFVNTIPAPGEKEDTRGRSLHRSNVINSDWANGRHYDGSGVTVTIADDGFVGPHIDFTGRLTSFATGVGSTHGDMTSGICVGAGNLDPTIRGMASGAYLYAVNWTSAYEWITDALQRYNDYGIVISSTSYSQGCNEYTAETQLGDQLLHDNQYMQFVFSGGNNGSGNCNYGAGAGWGNITGGYKQGKNVIACGNLDALEVLDPSSSRGPSSDGRVKPDICANGRDQLSTNENNTYQVGGGTSAASPGIAGVFAQLYQAWKELNNDSLAPAPLIKAALLNSAEDIGNPGPDFTYGWGRVNAYRAIKVLEDETWDTGVITNGATATHTITVPAGVTQLRAMVYWADPGGTPASAPSLVNDINMTVTDPSAVNWNPWILDPTPNAVNLNTPAVRGVDSLNNAEQVTIDNPAAGTYTVTLNGYAIPTSGVKYYVVWEFRTDEVTWTYPNGGEGLVPGETEVLRWDGRRNGGAYSVEYTDNNGSTWNIINANVAQNVQQLSWNVPGTVSGAVKFRVSRNGFTDESDTSLAIIPLPTGITVNWSCPDSMNISWNSVTGAVGYEVYALGAEYMDPKGTTTANSLTITGTNPFIDNWISVAAITPEGNIGRRQDAVFKSPGLTNCALAVDGGLLNVVSPGSTLLGCHDNSALPVIVTIQNGGVSAITTMDISYSLNNGPVVTETFNGNILQGASQSYTFTPTLNLTTSGTYQLKVWTALAGDQNVFNDSANVSINVIPGTTQSLPFLEDFESSGLCSDASNCEVTVCNITNGWINVGNGDGDDIDFRVQEGPTPSAGTGPDVDHTSGTATGNYAYLEASACFNRDAELLSPCIDLTTSTTPQLSFWYHMSGGDMGELHVDVLADGVWTNDVIPAIAGNQGTSWNQATANLSNWTGEIITIRFRASTGANYESDLAIDDINVQETNSAPIVAFSASETEVCISDTVTLTDLSVNSPTSWNWVISPSTFTFVNGTSATSQNPQIIFSAYGTYDVVLTATNTIGGNTLIKSAYVYVVPPAVAPIVEDFNAGVFPPFAWKIEGSGNTSVWEAAIAITGADGTTTDAASFDNYNLNAPGAEDHLITLETDLAGGASALLTFDVAYAQFTDTTYEDALRIDISTDCGATWTNGIYLKVGSVLATVPPTGSYTPAGAADWRKDTVDLSSYLGSNIFVRFTNINDFGNILYIDNVNIDLATGLGDAATIANVSVYPNPSKGVYNLELSNIKGNQMRYEVTDALGRVLISERVNASGSFRTSIDLSASAPGVYMLRLISEDGNQTTKLIRY